MSKFTSKYVREELATVCTIMDFSELETAGDKVQTFNNVAMHLLATAKGLDTALIFESKFPKGIQEIVDGYIEQWEALRVQLVKFNPEMYVAWANMFEIYPVADEPHEDPAFEGLGVEPPQFALEEEEAPKKAKKEKKAKTVEVEEEDVEVDDEIEEDDEELTDEDIEEELDEVLDEEFEDEVLDEEYEDEE